METITRIAIIEDNQIIRDNLSNYISMHEDLALISELRTNISSGLHDDVGKVNSGKG